MKLIKKAPEITKTSILNKVSDYDIYRHYTNTDLKIGRAINSVFRKDNNPSMVIRMGQDGELHHTDYGDDRYYGDCVDLVQQLYGIGYQQAIQKIAVDMQLVNGTDDYKKLVSSYNKPVMSQKRYCIIQIAARKWEDRDREYWGRFHITEEMLRNQHVYPLKEVFINRKKEKLAKDEICYAYWYDKGIKVYWPTRPKGGKWKSNIPLDTPVHLENLSKEHNALVVKSLKDYLVCVQLYPYTCYVQNESIGSVSEQTARYINENSRKVYYGGDSDEPGKKASYRITEKYQWLHINPPNRLLPDRKDWADWAEQEGLEAIRQHLIAKKVIYEQNKNSCTNKGTIGKNR